MGRRMDRSVPWARSAAYGTSMFGGIWFLFFPSVLVDQAVAPWLAATWACALIGSALVCLIGSVRGTWMEELMAIPLLSSTVWFFVIVLLAEALHGENRPVLTYAMLMIGYILLGLWPRFVEVNNYKFANRSIKETK